MDETTPTASDAPAEQTESTELRSDLLDDELLVEEISIDGMCGVY